MNVLLNASNLRFGGGFTVAYSLLEALLPLRPDDRFFLIHPVSKKYSELARFPNLILLPVPSLFHKSYVEKIRYNQFVFRNWCRKYDIHRVVSLGNVAINAGRLPQLLYLQLPHLVYPESVAWQRMDWKSFLYNSLQDQYIAYHMRHATCFAVQTPVMRSRLCHRFNLSPDRVVILPNAAVASAYPATPYQPPEDGRPLKLLFLSKYYPHKNFECLLPLARIIRQTGLPVQISLTITREESAPAAAILEALEESGVETVVSSIGSITLDQLGAAISAHHGIFLPSLLESFSGSYVEALRYNRPIFTSNLDFATELLGDAAFYFDPMKPEAMADTFKQAYDHPELVADKLARGAALYHQLPDWPQIAAQFSGLLDTFA